MRKTLLLLLLPVICTAKRDPCRQIKRTYDEEKHTHGFESPTLEHITVIKQNKPTTFFVLRFYLKDQEAHYGRQGAVVEFEDGTVLKNEEVEIKCSQEPSALASGSFGTETHSGGYVLQGFFKINEDNFEKFKSTKIARIYLSDVTAKIKGKEASQIMTFVGCIKDKK